MVALLVRQIRDVGRIEVSAAQAFQDLARCGGGHLAGFRADPEVALFRETQERHHVGKGFTLG